MKYRLSVLFLSMAFPMISMAQEVEMADGLRQSGKIYVVVVVLSIILLGLFGFLWYLDKKVSGIEKKSAKNA